MTTIGGFFFAGIFIVCTENIFVLKKKTAPYVDKKGVSGVGCYIINLPRSTGRLQSISPKVQALGYDMQVVEAFDGRLLDEWLKDNDVKKDELVRSDHYAARLKGKEPGLGEIGCYVSHVRALGAFLESSYAFGIIFEDDVHFDPAVLRSAVDSLVKKADLWDVCTFNLNPFQKGSPWSVFAVDSAEKTPRQACVYLSSAWCAGCYLVNRPAAWSLVQKVFPMQLPWDMYYARFWEFQGKDQRMMRFIGVEPRLVTQSYGDSEIDKISRQKQGIEAPYWSYIRMRGRFFCFMEKCSRFFYALWNVFVISKDQ